MHTCFHISTGKTLQVLCRCGSYLQSFAGWVNARCWQGIATEQREYLFLSKLRACKDRDLYGSFRQTVWAANAPHYFGSPRYLQRVPMEYKRCKVASSPMCLACLYNAKFSLVAAEIMCFEKLLSSGVFSHLLRALRRPHTRPLLPCYYTIAEMGPL